MHARDLHAAVGSGRARPGGARKCGARSGNARSGGARKCGDQERAASAARSNAMSAQVLTDKANLSARAAELKWFHAIDLGEARTAGRYKPGAPPNASLYGVMDMLAHVDLQGLDCVDVGTVDGLVALGLKAKGARRVVATDIPPEPRESFTIARQLLDLDVEFSGDTDMENIVDRLGEHRFDLVVCAGVMYHMLNPFDAVLKCRRLLKRNGLLILQTHFDKQANGAVMRFNQTENVTVNLNTFWSASREAVDGMMWLGGFELMATRTVHSPPFHAAIGRNARLDELAAAPGMIHQWHMEGLRPREFRRDLPADESTVRYTGPRDHLDINPKIYRPNYFPHPSEEKAVLGTAKPPQSASG
ncbi:MAG: class I SAM-dependent methyltransferase [Terricaulis sp.]|nr:class I SAM-dependent methyltransferase [Terricaulis sp.]